MVDPGDGDRRRLTTAIASAAEALTLEDVDRTVLPALAAAVGASETIIWRRTADDGAEGLAGTLAWYMPTFMRRYEPRDPYIDAVRRSGMPVVRSSRFVDLERFSHSELYHECHERLGVFDVVSGRIDGDSYLDPGMTKVVLLRAPDQPDFGPADEQALAATLPLIGAAVRRAERLEPVLRGAPVIEALLESLCPRPALALDTHGRLLWLSPRAERLLPARAGGGVALPDVLVAAARRVERTTAAGVAEQPPPARLAFPGRGVLPLRAQLYVARAPGVGRFLVVELEDFSLPGPAVDEVARRHGLTRAETGVLSALTLGLTNRAIAERLGVSPTTVRTHVTRILRKLGVASRTEAIMLVRDGGSGSSLL